MIDWQSKIKIVKETLYKKVKEITAKVSQIDYQKYINQVKILKHKMSELFFVLCLKIKKLEIKNKGIKAYAFLSEFFKWTINAIRVLCLKIKKLEIKNKGIKACAFLSGFFKWTINTIRAKLLKLLVELRRVKRQYLVIEQKNFKIPFIIGASFYLIAILITAFSKEIFYLFNFIYIGTAAAIGIFLSAAMKKEYAPFTRRITQLLIGSYMLIFLGFIRHENMQIEGFFFYLLMGVFSGTVIHYLIAKILGPFIFGRGWCGWACWTAMVLDFLPWHHPRNKRVKQFEYARYGVLILSSFIVFLIWMLSQNKWIYQNPWIALSWLIVGNMIYYGVGIGLAYQFRDNRAFCKYFCPIAVIMKQPARFSYMKVEIDYYKCNSCGLCEKSCMMDIKLLKYQSEGKRVLSTECVLCGSCIDSCPNNAIQMTCRIDYEGFGCGEKLRYSNPKSSAKG